MFFSIRTRRCAIIASVAGFVVLGVFSGRSFAVAPAPEVETGQVAAVGPRGGVVNGTINPHGRLVHYWVVFGRQRPSEHHTGLSEEVVDGNEPYEIGGVVLENLREGTVYHYRLVAVYGHQTKKAFGNERTFRTKCYAEGPDEEILVRPCKR